MTASVVTRPIEDRDLPFLYRVYASTRADELAQVDWSAEQKSAFLRMQFEAQRAYYEEQFPAADFRTIVVDGQPGGRLYVDRRPDEIRIIDIALLPEHRGSGIGTALMREILDEARARGTPVRIHVEQLNPALRLYQRLGFYRVETQGVYILMEWSPPGVPVDSP